MYCKSCGKKNSESTKFCKYCGYEVDGNPNEDAPKNEDEHSYEKHIDQDTTPFPYVIPIWKLVVMCVVTLGFYEIYWFYRHWKSFNSENKLGHSHFTLCVYSLFAPISSYSLFKRVSNNVKGINNGTGLEAGALALLYLLVNRILLGFLPLIPVQNRINLYWEKKYQDKLVKSNFGMWNWIIVIAVSLIVLFAIYSEDTPDTSTAIPETPVVESYNQEEIASSVVNIFCPSTIEGESLSGGSGTILTEDGIVLTNSHIIPQNTKELLVDETGCLVVLPDPITGQPSEIFLAHPIVIPSVSDDYDLAYMQIYSAYYDDEEKKYMGTYPKTFSAFNDTTRCSNENVKLGESVRIFGYPAISGGYSLTITDGVVSSLPEKGLIVTSAKISHGNSGGLAIDKDGCMVGVPSLVSSDESESLGIIYSMSLINEFSSEVSTYLEENK